ncbi:hypothetical protein K1719_022059 [Acacia pycnantha]|nr:hypothetical protein K1719_022059 [Acacia pycnantha]
MRSLDLAQVMKRTRSTSSSGISSSSKSPPLPSTPPTPQTLHKTRHSKSASVSLCYRSRKAKLTIDSISDSSKSDSAKWFPLNLSQQELCLPLTFPTGQTFRWKKTGPSQYTGVVGSHLISLKHVENGDVCYYLHHSDLEIDARTALLDFLNARVSLIDVWKEFSASDARITKMVDYISSLGNYLGTVGSFKFHTFPNMKQLSSISEEELRNAGFGYRAKYITGTVNSLQAKPDGGEEWLKSLRILDLQEVINALCTLPGVGPKVAACIALFSLDQHHAIPVDTHVWRIATKYLLPELAGSRLTPKLSSRVAEAFVSKYGKYAGWAQTLLFIAELPSQKTLLPPQLRIVEQSKHPVEDSEIGIV